ncbi:MAG: cytochrome C biogenesis protein [Robiginitomaculum sp.]|nr:MAG: cytochrome C biogenesis protein [Robiginitomaculum sp.]
MSVKSVFCKSLFCRSLGLIFVGLFMSLFISNAAFAQPLTEIEVEARAHEVGRALRCVVCQNQSIDESDADLAQDMRKLVRFRIRQGDSNAQVIAYMQSRYGDFVLLKPPMQKNTYFLWFAPIGLLLAFLIWYVFRTRRTTTQLQPLPLSNSEMVQFEKIANTQKTKPVKPNPENPNKETDT